MVEENSLSSYLFKACQTTSSHAADSEFISKRRASVNIRRETLVEFYPFQRDVSQMFFSWKASPLAASAKRSGMKWQLVNQLQSAGGQGKLALECVEAELLTVLWYANMPCLFGRKRGTEEGGMNSEDAKDFLLQFDLRNNLWECCMVNTKRRPFLRFGRAL